MQKAKAVASGSWNLPEACPGVNTTPTQRQVAPQGILYCLSRRYAREFFLLPDGYPGTGPGMIRERHGQHPAFLRTITLASALLKGRKDLPNPDSLHPCDAAEGRRRRGTSRMNTSGTNSCCAAPAFFACVSEETHSSILSCSGVGPCPAVFFLPQGETFPSPPVFSFSLHSGPGRRAG